MKRPNGSGNVYKRGQTWTARVVDHYVTVDGKLRPVWKTKGGFKKKSDALLYIPKLIEATPIAEKKPQTLESYWLAYERDDLPHLSTSKQVAYRSAWKKLDGIAHYSVDKLTVGLLRDTVNRVTTSYYTARDCKVLLNHLFALAAADGWVSKDLPSFITLPKLVEKEREVFTSNEQEALWKLYEKGNLDAAIPLVMIYTGLMPGEMMVLKTEHINLEKKTIFGVGMKTKVRRESVVYLPDDVVPVLEDLIAAAQPSGFLFKRVEREWYERYYSALEKAGCRRLEPYCCRHSTATRLAISEGVAPQTIQRMMRWSSTKMLDRYAHPDSDDLHAAANVLRRKQDKQDQPDQPEQQAEQGPQTDPETA